MDINIDTLRSFHPTAVECTFFLSAHRTFSNIDHIQGHKTALHKYKRIEIIPCIFSDHNAQKLGINHKKKIGKPPNAWRLQNFLLKREWVHQAIKEEIKNHMEANENENMQSKPFGMQQLQSLEENTLQSRPISRSKDGPKYRN